MSKGTTIQIIEEDLNGNTCRDITIYNVIKSKQDTDDETTVVITYADDTTITMRELKDRLWYVGYAGQQKCRTSLSYKKLWDKTWPLHKGY